MTSKILDYSISDITPFYSDLGHSHDNLEFNSQHEQEIFPFSKMSRLVPGPRLRTSEAILLLFLYAFMGCKETTVLFTAQNVARFAHKGGMPFFLYLFPNK